MTDPRITTLEDALKALGINPDNDPLHHAKRWISGRDDDRRERDRAIGDARAAAARIKDLEAKIASNVAEAAARDMRIAELERDLTTKADTLKTAHAALKRICEVIGAPVPACPDDVVGEVQARFAAKDDARSDAIRMAHAAAKISSDLAAAEITAALDDAGAPKVYDLPDDTERPIPDPERIRLLGERVRGEHAERIREGDRAQIYRDRLAAADLALDDRDAPRHADGVTLSPAARIRSLPR